MLSFSLSLQQRVFIKYVQTCNKLYVGAWSLLTLGYSEDKSTFIEVKWAPNVIYRLGFDFVF